MSHAATETVTEVVTLSQWLEALVERLSDPAERARMQEPWMLRLGYVPRHPEKAWAEVVSPGEILEFSNGQRERGRFERVTEIPLSAMLLMGELLEDTKRIKAK